ncbi:Multimeric flavodoxin WrbA (plasmid) [Paraburkholderia caribensis MBA4]|uniref:Multimeric flavodoxin WrbA n=2 Tax=Paraburkholderia caribensis TaxID=75105 RepID=A0A0P0RRN8_9BURK|nr:flavodoxin family protein [Paraburkholderia caribensis]ALL71792.1 Multimeric flavodoxin WrbA [Paraburkholderia caribensis MBA4]
MANSKAAAYNGEQPVVRKGQVTEKMSRETFRERFNARYYDPAYRIEDAAIERLEAIAWQAYEQGRKAPITEKAGAGFADPGYDLSVEWREASRRVEAAQERQQNPSTRSRILIINASARNDGTCPGEMSKSFRLARRIEAIITAAHLDADFLDLSLVTSDHDRNIHPCKACVSTAMPLCHWPCSCYPNHSLGQVNDWMNEIYERFAACHGVVIVTPVYWYQSPGPLKLMIDRLVCADGGNPDPSSTHGKDAQRAKQLELEGWPFPKHLKGRAYGLVVHGDVAGIEGSRTALADWLDWMGFIEAGAQARLERYIHYYEPYATSHAALDNDTAVQAETDNVARAVVNAVTAIREGRLRRPDDTLEPPRAK